MKLAAIYNVFDGEELLEASIDSIRQSVDIIIVVYQEISNFNEKNPHLINCLLNLKAKKKIDILVPFLPDFIFKAQSLESQKRQIGVKFAKENQCTHFLFIDTDECYDQQEFNLAKSTIVKNNCDATACEMNTYYFSPEFLLLPHATFYVPFIHKIYDNLSIAGPYYPLEVDPTRKTSRVNKFRKLLFLSKYYNSNFYLFKRNEIVMHHYSLVRKDIKKKFINSTLQTKSDRLILFLEQFKDWNIQKPVIFPYDTNFNSVVKVENKFNIFL